MKNRGLLTLRLLVSLLFGMSCIFAALTSHFVRPTHTHSAAVVINGFLLFFGAAGFVQAYVLQRNLIACF